MQADVDEISGDVFHIGPASRSVGDHQGNTVGTEQFDQRRIAITGMTHIQRVAHRAIHVGTGPCPPRESLVVPLREQASLGGAARKETEKCCQAVGVEWQVGR